MGHEKKQASVTNTHTKKAGKRNCPERVSCHRHRLRSSCYKHAQGTKGNRTQGIKGRYDDSVSSDGEYQSKDRNETQDQKETAELKSKITEKKNSVEGLSSIFKLSEERMTLVID